MEKKRLGWILLFIVALGLLAACVQAGAAVSGSPADISSTPPAAGPSSSAKTSARQGGGSKPGGTQTIPSCFFDELAAKAVAELTLPPHADDWTKVRAAYVYVVSRTWYIPFDDPTLSASWQYLDRCGHAPTPYQVMATSPLLYGIGSCENYACALMLLLDHMGFETLYVPGTTYSVEGAMVEHAWAMVRIEGNWYHIDPQLEDNVSQGMLQYKYYLKSDAEFSAHHTWASLLAQPTEYDLSLPDCPETTLPPPSETLVKKPEPALPQAVAAAEALRESRGEAVGVPPADTLPPFPEV